MLTEECILRGLCINPLGMTETYDLDSNRLADGS